MAYMSKYPSVTVHPSSAATDHTEPKGIYDAFMRRSNSDRSTKLSVRKFSKRDRAGTEPTYPFARIID